MNKTFILTITLFLLFGTTIYSQKQRGFQQFGGKISGIVFDDTDKAPLEYANVVVYNSETDEMVTGTISNKEGVFSIEKLKPGNYYVIVKFIGYEKSRIEDVIIRPNGRHVSLESIYLKRAAYGIDQVEIVAEKSIVEYKIDKKVINVGQQATSLSGTAIDALEISPAVRVDIDGTVSLRGSEDFTLLIDGKPSILDPSDALEQIPASSIDNIEIITNPSAKYDPDGTSGIINVILKKNGLSGIAGLVNINAGTFDNYGGNALIEYRNNGFSVNFGLNYNERTRPGTMESTVQTISNGVETTTNSNGERDRGGTMYGAKGGVSYDLTQSDNISAGFRYGNRDFGSTSNRYYSESSSNLSDVIEYNSRDETIMQGDFYALNLDYTHNFPTKDHKLYLQLYYSYRDMDQISFNALYSFDNDLIKAKDYTEGGPGKNWRIKAEYKLPFSTTDYLEAGYQGRISSDDEFNENYDLDLATNEYVLLDEFSHLSIYKRDIHSLFSTYAGESGQLGYQFGLRGEYTYRTMELVDENNFYEINRLDLFPTLHASYKFDYTFQTMASYTRRIVRPRGHYLEPFETWTDAYNVRKGNPGLLPEYINSFEIGTQKHFENVTFSLEGYYRYTTNKIERVRSVFSENVILHTVENVGTSQALGAEMMVTFNPLPFWNLNLTGNIYDYQQEGSVFGQDFNSSSFNYSLRMSNKLMFSKTFGTQFNFLWDSPSATSQGETTGRFILSAAATYQIIPQKLTAILQMRDVLQTARHEHTFSGVDFFSLNILERDWPMISLTLRYSINNYKEPRNGEMENGESEMEDDF